jgi:hypothetical protein
MPKIAICYWGMTRSTKLIYKSHIEKLYINLKKDDIAFEVFMHTWETENNINIIWENICNIPIDYNEYKLLNPNYYKVEKQIDFLNTINIENYFDEKLYNIYGGDTPNEWRPQLIKNHLCALESQKRCYNLVLDSSQGKKYKYIMFVRPDMLIQNNIDCNFIKNSTYKKEQMSHSRRLLQIRFIARILTQYTFATDKSSNCYGSTC